MSTATATAPQFSDGDIPEVPGQLGVVDLDALVDDEDQADEDQGADPAGAYDPAAPFGRFKSGRPRKSPAGSRSAKPGKPAGAPRPKVPGPPRKTGQGPRRAPEPPDYVAASQQLLHTLEALVGSAAAVIKQPALMADTATIVVMGPQLAEISGDIATHQAGWASTLERLSATSRWAPALNASVMLAAQVAVNHGLIPAGSMGTRTPSDMLTRCAEIVEERERALQEEAAKRERARAR